MWQLAKVVSEKIMPASLQGSVLWIQREEPFQIGSREYCHTNLYLQDLPLSIETNAIKFFALPNVRESVPFYEINNALGLPYTVQEALRRSQPVVIVTKTTLH